MKENLPPGMYVNATFPSMPYLRTQWNISADTFEAFLAWLDRDRRQAGKKYEDIRIRLIKIFASRGCSCPEDLTDETINRVIVKVQAINGDYQGDPARYFCGVARNVYHEYARKRTVPIVRPEPDPPGTRELELDCLDRCLDEVAVQNRELILRYYKGEKSSRIQNRNDMARELMTEPNALRIRVHRIRSVLQRCVGDCVARSAR